MPRKFDPEAQKISNLTNLKRQIIHSAYETTPGYPYKYFQKEGLYLLDNRVNDFYMAKVEGKPKRVDMLAAAPDIGRRTLVLTFKDSLEIKDAVELFRADNSEHGFGFHLEEEDHPGFVAEVYTQVRARLAKIAMDPSL